jgi:hypothetical protein
MLIFPCRTYCRELGSEEARGFRKTSPAISSYLEENFLQKGKACSNFKTGVILMKSIVN